MHANINITDGIYGGLSDSDINDQISSLTGKNLPDEKKLLKQLLRSTLERIEQLEHEFE